LSIVASHLPYRISGIILLFMGIILIFVGYLPQKTKWTRFVSASVVYWSFGNGIFFTFIVYSKTFEANSGLILAGINLFFVIWLVSCALINQLWLKKRRNK
jgi:uncharacterized membrane protein